MTPHGTHCKEAREVLLILLYAILEQKSIQFAIIYLHLLTFIKIGEEYPRLGGPWGFQPSPNLFLQYCYMPK